MKTSGKRWGTPVLMGLAAAAFAQVAGTAHAQTTYCLYEAPGDLDQDGNIDAIDIQCSLLLSLWAMDAEPDPATKPDCTLLIGKGSDINCDGDHSLVDAVVATAMAFGEEMGAVDGNGNGCPDACEVSVAADASCANRCGSVAPAGCWCDSICDQVGDCCEDACLACGECGEDAPDAPPPPVCGDGVCDAAGGESCGWCPDDCGACPTNSGSCCEPNSFPSCGDEACIALVCPTDPFCCDTSWDSICANAATEVCDSCGGTPPVCGDGNCNWNENCSSCADDCGECPTCGDAVCTEGFENCWSCPGDCGECPVCGDGVCAGNGWESCWTCPTDCTDCGEFPNAGSCCEVSGTAGCDDATCVFAVCSVDSFCCQASWDSFCVSYAEQVCEGCGAAPTVCGDGLCNQNTEWCGTCEADCGACPFCGDGVCAPVAGENCWSCAEDCQECTGGTGECCVFSNAPGCSDAACAATVCSQDSFCCDFTWDNLCAELALQLCEVCGATPPVCGDGFCNGAAGEWCSTCAEDCGACIECGDGICTPEYGETCWNCTGDCGACETGATPCCEPSNAPGCNDAVCTEVVCMMDTFCCQSAWDGICANLALEVCDVCVGQGPVCGDGFCSPSGENCTTCASDCGTCEFCGDGVCNPNAGETCFSCSSDCSEDCPPSTNDCCALGGGPGCSDANCQALICAQDPFCCNSAWDNICANAAIVQCDICAEFAPECGDGVCDGTFEKCSTCAADCGVCEFCGDGACSANAGETCSSCASDCGACPPSTGSCCTATSTKGCSDVTCQTTICAADPFCCNSQWDSICANTAKSSCAVCN